MIGYDLLGSMIIGAWIFLSILLLSVLSRHHCYVKGATIMCSPEGTNGMGQLNKVKLIMNNTDHIILEMLGPDLMGVYLCSLLLCQSFVYYI